MIRRALIFFLIAVSFTVSIVGSVPVQAGGQRWSAWMFNSDNGQLYLLTDVMNGTVQTLNLPMPAGYNHYPRNVAISSNWRYMAYTVTNTGNGKRLLHVYDREASRVAFAYPLPTTIGDSLDFAANEFVFNETNSQFAFSYSLDDQGWEIKIFDLAAGTAVQTLRHTDAAPRAQRIEAAFTLPVVQVFRGTQVVLTVIRLATEGAERYPNFTWNISTGEIKPSNAYPALGMDTLPATGENLAAAEDARFPNCGEACSPFFSANTLTTYDPASNTRFPFFTTPDLALYLPVFIQNGERILVGGQGRGEGSEPRHAVIERSGTLVGYMPSGTSIESAIGWIDGFLFMPPVVNPSGSPTLIAVNTRSGLGRGDIVWRGPAGAQNVRLLQTPGNLQSTGPFTAWARLAPSSGSSGGSGSSSGAAGTLRAGGQATVNTTAGDKLNMRSGPGRTFAIVAKLDAGTRVSLLEGPRSAEGLNWWRVRAPNGAEGWVIESVNDGGTIIQTLIPA